MKIEKSLELSDTLQDFKYWAQINHYDPLHKKKGLFFSSVFKNSLATFKNTHGIVPQTLIDNVYKYL